MRRNRHDAARWRDHVQPRVGIASTRDVRGLLGHPFVGIERFATLATQRSDREEKRRDRDAKQPLMTSSRRHGWTRRIYPTKS